MKTWRGRKLSIINRITLHGGIDILWPSKPRRHFFLWEKGIYTMDLLSWIYVDNDFPQSTPYTTSRAPSWLKSESPMSTLISEISFLSRHPAWYICHGAILQLSSRTFSEMAWSPIRCRWMGLTKYQFQLLEIMKKKRTNKNISSLSHLNFGIGPQMLMGWEYFCTYLF